MEPYLTPRHRELEKQVETFGQRIEMVDHVCEDANVADAYIKTWAKTQHAILDSGKMPKGVARYLKKIESRGFTSEGILGTVSREIVRLLGDEGLLKYLAPARYGGEGTKTDPISICIIRRGLAERSMLADVLFAAQGLGTLALLLSGSEALRRKYVRPAVQGEKITAAALTEPEAGSDLTSIETRAEKTRGGYILDGTKTLITNAGIADYYLVYVKTADAKTEPARALSAFVVPAESKGVALIRKIELMAPHPMGEIRFKKVLVPADHRVGKEGEGFDLAARSLDLFRVTVGAAAVGMASRALKESLDYAGRRQQFGKMLTGFQAIRFKLADMATELRAAELMVFDAAWHMAHGSTGTESSMSKLFATEAAQRIIDEAVQIHGGLGVVRGSAVERLYRAVRALRIYEGTSEIQRVIISRALTGQH